MIIVGVAAAAAVTALLGRPVIRLLERRAVVDVPVARSSHAVPTPRGGGVAPAVGASVGGLLAIGAGVGSIATIVGMALAFGLLGLREDVCGVPTFRRLGTQVVLAVVGAAALLAERDLTPLLLVFAPLAWAWLMAFVNAFNFMDGINGISAVQASLAGSAWAAVGGWQDDQVLLATGAVVAAAAVAFLPFNFPRAKVFLGDTGSYFLGGWLAAMVVVAILAGWTPEMALAPVLVYLADSGTTLVRRVVRRAPLTEPHRDHVYQQLVIGGWSHARTTLVVALGISVCCLLGAATMVDWTSTRVAADLGLVVVVLAYLAAPRWQARRRPTPSGLVLPGGPR